MNGRGFEPALAAGVVAHMNEDHADALLAIVRAFGGSRAGATDGATDRAPDAARNATAARLVAITPDALDLEFDTAAGTGRATVALEPPIASSGAVRARLVALTRAARAALDAT